MKLSYSWEQGKQGQHSWKMCGKLFRQYVWNSVRKILCSLNMPTCSEPSQHNLIFGASPVMQYGKPIFTIFYFAQRMHKANLGITTTLYCEYMWDFKNKTLITSNHSLFLLSHRHLFTQQVPWWVKFLWACSRQCRKTTDNLHMDRQCKKTTDNLHMDRQCKKTTNNLHMDRQCKKLHWSIYSAPDSAKKTTTAIYIWTDSAKKQQQFTYGQYIFTDCTEDSVQNTHTYTQYT